MVDNTGMEVIRVTRDFNCLLYCLFRKCYNNEIVIEAPVGVPIGNKISFDQINISLIY